MIEPSDGEAAELLTSCGTDRGLTTASPMLARNFAPLTEAASKLLIRLYCFCEPENSAHRLSFGLKQLDCVVCLHHSLN